MLKRSNCYTERLSGQFLRARHDHDVELAVGKLSWDQCKDLIVMTRWDLYAFPTLATLHRAVRQAVFAGEVLLSTVKDITA